MGSNTSRPAVQLSFEPDRTADQHGQQQGRHVQMPELFCYQTQIHGRKIGRKAAGIEVNPAQSNLGTDLPVAISTRRRGDWRSTRAKRPPVVIQPVADLAVDGAPSTTRTCDLLDRNQTLYPTELWARFKSGAEAYRIDDNSEYLAVGAV